MPDRSLATQESIASALRTLTKSPLAHVRYYGFGLGLPGGQPTDPEWGDATDQYSDDAQHHFPAMGVELVLQDGTSITVCWGDAFGRFGLEVFALPALDAFHNRPAQSEVTEHRWWSPFVGPTISGEM